MSAALSIDILLESVSQLRMKDLRLLVETADKRLHSEFKPNKKTVAAMEEARNGQLKSFNSIDDLMADLNAEA